MAQDLSKFKKDFVLHLEAGFIAVNQSDEDSAKKLFRAASILDPKSNLPELGLGYMHLCKLELKQSAEKFKGVLEKEPENEMAKTFMAIAMSMSPDHGSEGEKLLTELATSSGNEDVKKLTDMSLDFVDKYVKGPQSPADLQAEQSKKHTGDKK